MRRRIQAVHRAAVRIGGLFGAMGATLLLAAAHSPAEIIDRIAVSIGNQVITASDLNREIRVNAFLNQVKPDLSQSVKRSTADRMVEQRLVRRELQISRYPVPAPADVEPVLAKFKQEHYPEDAAYRRALADYGISDAEVRDHLLWQLTLLRFIEVRFRPGVQVTDEEIREYFDKVIKPAATLASPGTPPSLDDYRDRIEETITEQKVDKELDAWIQEARKRTGVEYRQEVFER